MPVIYLSEDVILHGIYGPMQYQDVSIEMSRLFKVDKTIDDMIET